MQKIIDKHKHDKENKKSYHESVPDSLDGEIILSIDEQGIMSCLESSLDYLLLDDPELIKTGWDKHKVKFIADNTIKQKDINDEKVKPEVAARLVILKNKINNAE
jgi:hypothetical protein